MALAIWKTLQSIVGLQSARIITRPAMFQDELFAKSTQLSITRRRADCRLEQAAQAYRIAQRQTDPCHLGACQYAPERTKVAVDVERFSEGGKTGLHRPFQTGKRWGA